MKQTVLLDPFTSRVKLSGNSDLFLNLRHFLGIFCLSFVISAVCPDREYDHNVLLRYVHFVYSYFNKLQQSSYYFRRIEQYLAFKHLDRYMFLEYFLLVFYSSSGLVST